MSSKIGVNLSIDVTKINKADLYQGKNGAQYLSMTVFIDPNEIGRYGDHGMITQSISKEQKDAGEQGAILGNAKVFWSEDNSHAKQDQQQAPQQQNNPSAEFDTKSEDIPF